jgi:hypothetical protein
MDGAGYRSASSLSAALYSVVFIASVENDIDGRPADWR